MIRAGLCSVTLRQLTVFDVAAVAAEAGLEALEWGGDVHVPPGDSDAVRRALRACDRHGLTVGSYGSYLVADGRVSPDEVRRVLDTAVELGAPGVRVWPPFVRPGRATPAELDAAVDALSAIAGAAAERRLCVSLELHGGTLTETAASTVSLLRRVGAATLRTYWQPAHGLAPVALLDELDAVRPWLTHLHVFRWRTDEERLPLADGHDLWPQVLARVADDRWDGAAGPDRLALLEFVPDDDPAGVVRDAAVLRSWLADPA